MLKQKINRLCRIITTGFCFATFGLGALTLVTTIFPVATLLHGSQRRKTIAVRKIIQLSFRLFIWLMSSLRLISVTTRNFAPALASRGQIIVANHPSLIDIVILISILPQSDCIVKESLGKNFFLKNVIKAAYVLSSTNVTDLFQTCRESLAQGNSFVIFPEGTRTVPGKKSTYSRGAAQLAIATQADILPIHISCNPPGLLKHQKWYDVADSALVYVLEARPLIKIQPYLDDSASNNTLARQLTAEIEALLR